MQKQERQQEIEDAKALKETLSNIEVEVSEKLVKVVNCLDQ